MIEFKAKYYFFDPKEFGRVYTFVDFGNVRPWAKDFWPEENKFRLDLEIDIKKLASVCDWVNPDKKFFYYGYFAKKENQEENHPDNKKYRSSIFRIDKARDFGFSVRSKEIKMIPHYNERGKFIGRIPKCNFDVEITMDMITKISKFDTAVLFSGDSDFGNLLGYLKSKDKKVVIVCTRSRMSKELQEVANKFIPAETLKEFLRYENKNTPPLRAEV